MFFLCFLPYMVLGRPARAADILTWRDGSIRQPRNIWKPETEEIKAFQNHIFGPVCYSISLFDLFLKKMISYGSSGQTPLWKWIVYGFSSFGLGPSESILIAFWISSPTFCWKVFFHFKPSGTNYLCARGSLVYPQDTVCYNKFFGIYRDI